MKTLLLGIGNDILTDDGIGPRLVRYFESNNTLPDLIFQTACTGGMEIVEMIRGYQKVIIIDAIKTGCYPPGTVRLFTPDDFSETSNISSVHDISFLTALELASQLDIDVPASIHIIAVEIMIDLEFSTSFSPQVSAVYDEIVNNVHQHLVRLTGRQ